MTDRVLVSLSRAIQVLNEALELDPVTVRDLVEARVWCNRGLADHRTIQAGDEKESVRLMGAEPPNLARPYCVGLLGILNGIFGCDGDSYGFISAIVEKDGTVSSFKVLNRD